MQANRLFTALEPWKSDTSDTDVINAMVFAHESLRLLGIALTPIMPSKTAELLGSLHVSPDKRIWEDLVWDEEAALRRVVESVNSAMQVKGKKQVLFPALVEDA
jgi:methionyl-tRNA synthetase